MCTNKFILLTAISLTMLSSAAFAAQQGPDCNRSCTPAEWQSLSTADRAALWPVMTNQNRRQIWLLMDEHEKAELREALRPMTREALRQHYDCAVNTGRPVMREDRPVMSQHDREQLKHQIITVHEEYLRIYRMPKPQ